MAWFSPVGQALARKLLGAQSLADVCASSFDIGEPLDVERREAVHVPGDLDRVTGFAPSRSLALEQLRLRPGPMHLRAGRACVLEDALVVDGNVYKARAKHAVAGNTRTWLASFDTREPGGILVANRQSHAYFGHWLTEELPLTAQLRTRGAIVTTHFGRQPYSHEAGYARVYGVETPRELPRRCALSQLTVVEGGGLNAAHVRGIAALRQSLVDAGWRPSNRHVFIRRGGGSPRRLVNEDAVVDALAARGFAVVDPERAAPEEIARACFGAEVVVGVEGSHLAHGLMQLGRGSALVTIQPPDRFNNPFKDFCDVGGLTYGYVVASPAGEGFSLPPDLLLQLLDQLP